MAVVEWPIRAAALWFAVCLTAGTAASSQGSPAQPESCLTAQCLASASVAAIANAKKEDLGIIAEALAQAGRLTDAKTVARMIDGKDPRSQYERDSATRLIAILEIVTEAWKAPSSPADFAPLDAIATGSATDMNTENAANYWQLAGEILHHSWSANNPVELGKLLRKKFALHSTNATLQNLLQVRWPSTIEALPIRSQGLYWTYIADVWVNLGDRAAAIGALQRAERSEAYDFQGTNRVFDYTARLWLRVDDFDGALAAARQASSKSAASHMEVDIGKALLAEGRPDEAISSFDEALSNADGESPGQRMLLLRAILDGILDAGNRGGAQSVANEMSALAQQPYLFPAAQLGTVAAG